MDTVTQTRAENQPPASNPRRSGPFAQIPSAAVFDQRLSADAFRLLAALTTHADHHGECYPRQASLAYALGVCQASVSNWLRELEALGYVTIIGRRRYGPRAWRYVYQIQYQPSAPTDVEDITTVITSGEDITPTILSARNNKNISIKNRRLIPPVPSSLERDLSLNTPPCVSPENVSGACGAGGQEKTKSDYDNQGTALARDPLYRTLSDTLGYQPVMPRERDQWRLVINNFRRKGVTPEQLLAVMTTYAQTWPTRKCTPMALENNWALLTGGPTSGTGMAITESIGKARREREQAERDAFDWRAAREIIRAEFAEVGLTLEQLYGDAMDDPDTYRPRHA